MGHVQAFTFGYDRDVDVLPSFRTAVGAQVTVYGVPGALEQIYGSRPMAVQVFIRFRPFSGTER